MLFVRPDLLPNLTVLLLILLKSDLHVLNVFLFNKNLTLLTFMTV